MASVLDELATALESRGTAILVAPPGAGKTTLVPLHLLSVGWLDGRSILMLQPRRLATRQAAMRMAELLGEPPGETIGYAMRFERRAGPRTRIEVITEGLLTRRLQRDPSLADVGLLVFDEFHERSLDAELGLALSLEARDALRPDLRLLVMSATLDPGPLAELLGGAPVVACEGRRFPITTRYMPSASPVDPIDRQVAAAVRRAWPETEGDILVFLPGAAEIRRTAAALGRSGLDAMAVVCPLMGDLGKAEQDRALRRAPDGRRKIVLATNIAETSLTIEGVTTVIDTGLARRPVFSARTGMSRLATVRISRAAADQRRGRAGRLGPGSCWRLWDPREEAALPAYEPAEIETTDLAPLALELAAWGTSDATTLRWPTPPPAAPLARARALLQELGALDDGGRITAHGRAIAALPLHPRLAHMLVHGAERGAGPTALAVAALLEARDPWRGERERDLAERLRRWVDRAPAADPAALMELERTRRQLRRLVDRTDGAPDIAATGAVLALAYPERLAQQRGGPGHYRLSSGRGAALHPGERLASEPFLAIAELDDSGADARILSAAAIDEEALSALCADRIVETDEVRLDPQSGNVIARRIRRLGALVLGEQVLPRPDPAAVANALLMAVRERGIEPLIEASPAEAFLARLRFLARHAPEIWPDVSLPALETRLDEWLGPWLAGLRSLEDVRRLDLRRALEILLTPEQRREVERLAPSHFTPPLGGHVRIDYRADPPVLAIRLQELLGQAEHPTVLGGRVRLSLHLLSPAGRPVQITQDLPAFWRGSYAAVRKEMRGRYPKHAWPEDPLAAAPTRRTRSSAGR